MLALAAYNSGQGSVEKAVIRNRSLGKPTDFWSLDLPKETETYPPKLLALAKILSAPEKYGIALTPISNEPYFAKVDIGSQMDLAQAAKLANLTIDEVYRLNPGFNRWTTAPEGPFQLLLPEENAPLFKQRLAVLPANKRVSWVRYKVKPGEGLLTIANKHHANLETLRRVNRIRGNSMKAGKELLIPISSESADYYALSIDERLKSNQSNSNSFVRAAVNSTKISEKLTHKVKSGESFWTISQHYGVKITNLASWNNMSPKDVLHANQQLTVWKNNPASGNIKISKDSTKGIRKVGYKVKTGDSLARIADKFNVKVTDIVKWNTLKANRHLQPGQGLNLYVDAKNIQ
jgi:membrane-bound lytic murein transglycosylase D